jgi:hypothetical protein
MIFLSSRTIQDFKLAPAAALQNTQNTCEEAKVVALNSPSYLKEKITT